MPFQLLPRLGRAKVSNEETYEPPQGPPPSKANNESQEAPPSYEEWMSVRENPSSSGLPPPPNIHYDESPRHNAPIDEATQADDWCKQFPLYWPQQRNTGAYLDIINGRSTIVPVDPSMTKRGLRLESSTTAQTIKSKAFVYQCLRSETPLYSALQSKPVPAESFTTYFEIKITKLNPKSGIVALGYFAPPYPSFRLPGWQRSSIGVHGDDGRRYVNDSYGGMDFTKPFKEGEVIGIGMKFGLSAGLSRDEITLHIFADHLIGHKETKQAAGSVERCTNVTCFMTRNGFRIPEWQWDLHEELDVDVDRPGGVEGLEGDRDLYAAIGVYGAVTVEARFGKERCSWWPS